MCEILHIVDVEGVKLVFCVLAKATGTMTCLKCIMNLKMDNYSFQVTDCCFTIITYIYLTIHNITDTEVTFSSNEHGIINLPGIYSK